ncbi:Sec-independent protein translocase protein TatB, partial [Acidomonas methanolica]
MFDFSWSEIAIIVIVALVFIRPADLPVALRALSRGVRAVRRMAAEFQGHVDEMVREADMGEVREQFRDLRRFDLRTKVERAIDADGTLRRSFEPPPSLSLAPPLAP